MEVGKAKLAQLAETSAALQAINEFPDGLVGFGV
jgi:hypothetical protein